MKGGKESIKVFQRKSICWNKRKRMRLLSTFKALFMECD